MCGWVSGRGRGENLQLSTEPDMRFNSMTLKSWHEPKPRAGHSTESPRCPRSWDIEACRHFRGLYKITKLRSHALDTFTSMQEIEINTSLLFPFAFHLSVSLETFSDASGWSREIVLWCAGHRVWNGHLSLNVLQELLKCAGRLLSFCHVCCNRFANCF